MRDAKYFMFGGSFHGGAHGLRLANRERYDDSRKAFYGELLAHEPSSWLERRARIFDLAEMPRFIYEPGLGEWPRDLEIFGEYWLVSQRLKQALETLDPGAVQFVRAEVFVLEQGTETRVDAPIWIASVVRQVALDETRSELDIEHEPIGYKLYRFRPGARLTFDSEAVQGRHLFRTPHSLQVFCDETLLTALREGGFTGWSVGSQVSGPIS